MLTYADVSGADVNRILDKIEGSLAGETRGNVIVSMLVGVVLFQNPTIDEKVLVDTVKSISEYITSLLMAIEDPQDVN